MAQISIGKLLPNLKVTLGNDVAESEYSEEKGYEFSEKVVENSDNPNVEIVRSWMKSLQSPKIYKNKSGGFTTGLDLISEDNTEVLGKRAERFGLEKEESSLTPSISSLYESMGISIENRNSAKTKNIRLDALHLRGVNELNTNEIFHYFRDFGPASVEWINDFSCNVVWLDETSCARALLGVSKPFSGSKTNTVEETVPQDAVDITDDQESAPFGLSDNKEEANMDVDDDSQIKSCSSESSVAPDIPVPPGQWRLGVPHPKAKTILLRFATKDDKKLPGAEKRSDYYKKYGNPNYGGLKGLISSSRKRKIQASVNKLAVEKGTSSNKTVLPTYSDAHQSDAAVPKANPKPPRMRMYADDEELKTRKFWSDDNFTENQQSVHSRLGSKYTKDDLCHLGNYYGGSERDKRPRDVDDYELDDLSSTSRSTKWDKKRNWSSENQVDLRTKLKRLRSDSGSKHSRSDNGSKHRSPLCVDIESRSED